MARLIKFNTQCSYCGLRFDKNQAFLQRDKALKKWKCQCFSCYEKRKNFEAENPPLEKIKERMDTLIEKFTFIEEPEAVEVCEDLLKACSALDELIEIVDKDAVRWLSTLSGEALLKEISERVC